MTDEIKEIIEHIKTYPEKMYCLSEKEKVIMLDYITNLQQAIEIKNQRIKEEQQEKERYIKSYNGLNTWNKELKQENEKLKEEIDILKSNFEVEIDDCENYKKWYRDYKSRCEKAIEYVKEHIKYECDDNFNGMSFYSYHLYDFKKEDLLNILNGSDENER